MLGIPLEEGDVGGRAVVFAFKGKRNSKGKTVGLSLTKSSTNLHHNHRMEEFCVTCIEGIQFLSWSNFLRV